MRKTVLLAVVIVVAMCVTPVVWADATLGFSPASQTVLLGNQATVTIQASNATNGVGNYDFRVTYNAGILSLASVIDNAGLGNFSYTTPVGGELAVVDFSLDPFLSPQALPLDLFTVTFNTLTTGTSALTIIPTSAGGYPTTLGDVSGTSYGVTDTLTLNAGSIDVVGPSQVPEPASLALLGIGLVGLARLRKK